MHLHRRLQLFLYLLVRNVLDANHTVQYHIPYLYFIFSALYEIKKCCERIEFWIFYPFQLICNECLAALLVNTQLPEQMLYRTASKGFTISSPTTIYICPTTVYVYLVRFVHLVKSEFCNKILSLCSVFSETIQSQLSGHNCSSVSAFSFPPITYHQSQSWGKLFWKLTLVKQTYTGSLLMLSEK